MNNLTESESEKNNKTRKEKEKNEEIEEKLEREEEIEEEEEESFNVDPWNVEGIINYDKLCVNFGCNLVTNEMLKKNMKK